MQVFVIEVTEQFSIFHIFAIGKMLYDQYSGAKITLYVLKDFNSIAIL